MLECIILYQKTSLPFYSIETIANKLSGAHVSWLTIQIYFIIQKNYHEKTSKSVIKI